MRIDSTARVAARRAAVLSASIACATMPAHAQTGASADAGGREGALSDVVVTATRFATPAMSVPASVSVVPRETLERIAPARLGDALADVPGLYVRGAAMGATFPGSGQAVLSLRGVPRSGRTLVLVDGQPLNNALSGSINVAGIPLAAIERVEIVRGPHSALYGGNAMGGVINFISAPIDAPLAQASAGVGSQGLRTLAAQWRRRLDSGLGLALVFARRESAGNADADEVVKTASAGAGTAGLVGATQTVQRSGAEGWLVGYKERRPWVQTQLGLSASYRLAPGTQLRGGVSLGQYRVGHAAPSSLLLDAGGQSVLAGNVAVGAGRRVVVRESDFLTQTDSLERDLRAWARAEHRYAGGTVMVVDASVLRHRFTFPFATPGATSASGGPGQFTVQPDVRTDLGAHWRVALGKSLLLTTGFAFSRGELERSTLALSNWRDEATQTAVLNQGQGAILDTAVFVQGEYFATDRLTLTLGARHDRYTTHGMVSQTTAPAFAQTYADRSFGAFAPKAALSYRVSPALTLRASYGVGFRAPTLLDLYSRTAVPGTVAGTVVVNEPDPNLLPERIRALEVGADGNWGRRGRWSLTVYRQSLRDLLYRRTISSSLTRTENVGEARVDGVEASARWYALDGRGAGSGGTTVALGASLTHHLRYEVTRNDATPGMVGKRLTDVPRSQFSLGAEFVRGPWSGFVAWRYTSMVYGSGDDLNQNSVQGVYGAYDAHGVVSARLAWQATRQLAVSLAIDNLTNRRYYAFYRQPGRTALLEATLRF